MNITLEMVQTVLDALKDQGLDSREIARRLELHQVHSNARSLRHWYSGKTQCRTVEYMALRELNANLEGGNGP